MAAQISPHVRLFREPGYPYVAAEVGDLLDRSLRVVESEDDPVEAAGDLARVLEIAAQALRDLGAEEFMRRERAAS